MRYAEYCQYIEYAKMSVEEMEEEVSRRPVKRWAYLVHDKDEKPDGTPKESHIHIMMELNGDTALKDIASWFKDETQYIEKAKSRIKPYENMCSYLIHETASSDGSYHYDPKDVKANFDYVAFIEQIRKEVKEATETPRQTRDPLKPILVKIADNEIPRLEITRYVDTYTYIKRKRDIDIAYSLRDARIASREIDRDMKVMYISGEAGSGKTTLAKMMAEEMGYSIFVSGSSNDPLEGYMGQECVIVDDIRGSDWKINDLLKLLDNHTNSLARSRYSNKNMVDCKLIILTSVEPIETLYNNLKDSGKTEPITQLKRRCTTWMVVSKDKVRQYNYDAKFDKYELRQVTPNPVALIEFVADNTSLFEAFDRLSKRITANREAKKALGGDTNSTTEMPSKNAYEWLTEGRPNNETEE